MTKRSRYALTSRGLYGNSNGSFSFFPPGLSEPLAVGSGSGGAEARPDWNCCRTKSVSCRWNSSGDRGPLRNGLLIFQVEIIHRLCHKTKEMDDDSLGLERRRLEEAL